MLLQASATPASDGCTAGEAAADGEGVVEVDPERELTAGVGSASLGLERQPASRKTNPKTSTVRGPWQPQFDASMFSMTNISCRVLLADGVGFDQRGRRP